MAASGPDDVTDLDHDDNEGEEEVTVRQYCSFGGSSVVFVQNYLGCGDFVLVGGWLRDGSLRFLDNPKQTFQPCGRKQERSRC